MLSSSMLFDKDVAALHDPRVTVAPPSDSLR